MAFSLVEAVVRTAVAVLSVLVFAVGAAAYARRPTGRTLLMLALLALFLVQGLVLLFEVVVVDTSLTETGYYAFQFAEVLIVTALIVKR